jgi:hypothetical protein
MVLGKYWVAPAFHRVSAYRAARKNPIACTHRNGICGVKHVRDVVSRWLNIGQHSHFGTLMGGAYGRWKV